MEELYMKNLLTKQEHRWFYFIQTLTNNDDWTLLADLSSLLDCSKRILKMDLRYLNEEFDDFTILTSNTGLKIDYHPNRSFKTFCHKLLLLSDSYRLLEIIFLNEDIKVKEVSDQLDISLSTLYRMIEKLNIDLKENYDFIIETGPCRIVGDEEKIRFFFYTYFFEKYRHANWPFEEINLETMNVLTDEFMALKNVSYDFAYFNIVNIVIVVNYFRYRNNHYVDMKNNQRLVEDLLQNTDEALRHKIETTFELQFNKDFILQILNPFIQPEIYHTEKEFIAAIETNCKLNLITDKMRTILKTIALKNNLSLPNVDSLLYILYSAAYLEYSLPQSRYILFDRNHYFATEIKKQFPTLYNSLYEGMQEMRTIFDKPETEAGTKFFIFTVVSWWENLIPQLHQNHYKVNVLIVSDRHQKHAEMMKNFIQFEFGEKLIIETTTTSDLSYDSGYLMQYDLIITTYMDNRLTPYDNVYITNIPRKEDYDHIRKYILSNYACRLKEAHKLD